MSIWRTNTRICPYQLLYKKFDTFPIYEQNRCFYIIYKVRLPNIIITFAYKI